MIGATGRSGIRRATRQDAEAISELRLSAYSGAPEFTVKDESALQWSADDDNNVVLAVWDADGRALSTTRGDLLFDRHQAQRKMECELAHLPIPFPALQLGKGATVSSSASLGLHSALRLCFLDASQRQNVQGILGIVYEGAPRTRLMRSIGYRFHRPSSYWYEDLDAHRETLVAVLDRDHFPTAAALLRARVGDTLNQYPCDIDELTREIGRGLADPPR